MDDSVSSERLIQMHTNPIKTVDLPSKRGLIPTNSAEEIETINETLKSMKEFLSQVRVDRKNNRSEAIWLPEKRISKLTRRSGKVIANFGFSENGETFLTPEESLYLIETNYLDLLWNEVPFSIEQGYMVLLNSYEDLEKYRAFKELALLGFKIQKPKPEDTNKRKLVEENSNNKKLKSEESKLVLEGPKSANICENYTSIYNVYLPKNSVKKSNPNFEIIKKEGNEFSHICASGINSSTVTCFTGNESVSFYQFHEVELEN